MSPVRDYGNHKGAKGSVVSDKGQTYGMCDICENKQVVTKNAWRRKTRPKCKHCGALLYPSNAAQDRIPELSVRGPKQLQRVCLDCGAKLRSGNSSNWCSPCLSRDCK